MKLYELTYLIKPEIDEKELNLLSEKIKSLIKEKEGILGKENEPIKKKLGYQIKKKSLAYIRTLEFQLEPDKLLEIKKEIESQKDILRFLFVVKKIERHRPLLRTIPKTITKPPLAEKEEKKKVELKDIEKKLEEILDE